MTRQGELLARKVTLWQLSLGMFICLLFAIFSNQQHALAALCGLIIGVMPQWIFNRFAFRYAGARQSQLVVRSFSQGAKFKLIMTIGLFVVAFAVLKAEPIPLFLTYATTIAALWGAMLLQARKH